MAAEILTKAERVSEDGVRRRIRREGVTTRSVLLFEA
jgi:hypothetical protein